MKQLLNRLFKKHRVYKYVTENGFCETPCPHHDDVKIGSVWCQECRCFVFKSVWNNKIGCSFSIFNMDTKCPKL